MEKTLMDRPSAKQLAEDCAVHGVHRRFLHHLRPDSASHHLGKVHGAKKEEHTHTDGFYTRVVADLSATLACIYESTQSFLSDMLPP